LECKNELANHMKNWESIEDSNPKIWISGQAIESFQFYV